MTLRFVCSVGLVVTLGVAASACKKEEVRPEPGPPGSASALAAHTLPRVPTPPAVHVDPVEVKEFRVDTCYLGTLTFRQARAYYFASLGKSEPSATKIPRFTSAAAAAKAPPAAGSAAPVPMRHHGDMFEAHGRAPYERSARQCQAAMAMKEPAMGDVDAAISAYAPMAAELAKDLFAASMYYDHQEYKKDDFAKGKELHKKLVDSFQKIDDLEDKLGVALSAWHKDHPFDVSKITDEGDRDAANLAQDGRALVEVAIAKKPDADAFKASTGKLEQSLGVLKTYGGANASDPWAKIVATPGEALLRTAKETTITDKGIDPDQLSSLLNTYLGLSEARQRAASRNAAKRPGAIPPPNPGAAPASATGAAPAPETQP